MNSKIYTIKGMHCRGCANTVQNVLQEVEGLNQINVHFKEATASIKSKQPIELAVLNKALSNYGDFKLFPQN